MAEPDPINPTAKRTEGRAVAPEAAREPEDSAASAGAGAADGTEKADPEAAAGPKPGADAKALESNKGVRADAPTGTRSAGAPPGADQPAATGDQTAPQIQQATAPAAAPAAPRANGQPPGHTPPIDGFDLAISEPSEAHWATRSKEERRAYIDEVKKYHYKEIEQCGAQANLCVAAHRELARKNQWWKDFLVWVAGSLAVLNVTMTFTQGIHVDENDIPWYGYVFKALPLLAAVWAAFIAIFTNLESAAGFGRRAQAFREGRELFVDVAREGELLWLRYVRPFLDTPTACVNAAAVYRRIVERDRELRSKFKELTDERVRQDATGGSGAGGGGAGARG